MVDVGGWYDSNPEKAHVHMTSISKVNAKIQFQDYIFYCCIHAENIFRNLQMFKNNFPNYNHNSILKTIGHTKFKTIDHFHLIKFLSIKKRIFLRISKTTGISNCPL